MRFCAMWKGIRYGPTSQRPSNGGGQVYTNALTKARLAPCFTRGRCLCRVIGSSASTDPKRKANSMACVERFKRTNHSVRKLGRLPLRLIWGWSSPSGSAGGRKKMRSKALNDPRPHLSLRQCGRPKKEEVKGAK